MLITPVRWLVRTVAEWFITLIVGRERSRGNIITEDMVRTLAHEAVGEGVLDHMEAQYIDQIFDFGNKTLSDVMTPRSDIHFIAVGTPLGQVVQELKASKQSRFPVYREHRDTVLGILHARDLLGMDLARLEQDPEGLLKLLREPSFFPESKLALELFHTFRERRQSFALIVDEYGGVTGLVTMEDLLECVFGDIRSPSDVSDRELIKDLGEGRFLVDPAIPLEEFNYKFATLFEFEQVETLAGFLLHEFGELPGQGSRVDIEQYRFSVQGVEANRITQVLMEKLPIANAPAAQKRLQPPQTQERDGQFEPPQPAEEADTKTQPAAPGEEG